MVGPVRPRKTSMICDPFGTAPLVSLQIYIAPFFLFTRPFYCRVNVFFLSLSLSSFHCVVRFFFCLLVGDVTAVCPVRPPSCSSRSFELSSSCLFLRFLLPPGGCLSYFWKRWHPNFGEITNYLIKPPVLCVALLRKTLC